MIGARNDITDEVGFVYLCNPNNPTGLIVTKQEVKQLLDGMPEDMPVLIDEAYHHFVDDPNYATSIPYVLEGRPVIIARTFSKIAALAGMRLGYAIAPREMIQQMRPYSDGHDQRDREVGRRRRAQGHRAQAEVKRVTLDLRKKTTARAEGAGLRRDSVGDELLHGAPQAPGAAGDRGVPQKKGVLVGRPFPPMIEHLRVSIGTADEMDRFMVAFKEILPAVGKTATAG